MMELYPEYLKSGYSPDSFWDSSLRDVIDVIKARNSRIKEEMKKDAIIASKLAQNIGEYIALALGGEESGVQISQVWDLHPLLFEEEEKAYIEEQKASAEWEAYKDRRAAFAQKYNKSRKG